MASRWKKEEIDFLIANYRRGLSMDIAEKLERSVNSIRHKATQLGLCGTHTTWTKAENRYLARHYPDKGYPLAKMVEHLDRTEPAIKTQAQRLGIYRKYVPDAYCIDCGCKLNKFYHAERCITCSNKHRSGENHHNWQGGISTLTDMIRRALYPVWTFPVMERDNFTCRLCGHYRNNHVHHLRPLKDIMDAVISDHPELSIENSEDKIKIAEMVVALHRLEDGITVCKSCHIFIHYSEKPGELLESPNVKARAISSQASEGEGSEEGSTTRRVSPNNNPAHERPALCR